MEDVMSYKAAIDRAPKGAKKAARVALLDENGQEVDPSSLRLHLD
jgi:proline racemase